MRSGQLAHFTVSIFDSPGAMARLTTLINEAGANIVELSHDRLNLYLNLNLKGAAVRVIAEVQDRAHGKALMQALRKVGFAVAADPA